MRTSTYVLLFMAVFLVIACQKNDVSPDEGAELKAYFPLEAGNYWVYNFYTFKEGETPTYQHTDTLKIVGTTDLNGELFFEMGVPRQLNFFFPHYLRQSGAQLLDEEGKVFLQLDNGSAPFQRDTVYNGTLGEPIAAFSRRLADDEALLEVPAGKFSCLDVVTDVDIFAPYEVTGDRTQHDYFAKNVGLVNKQIYYVSVPNGWEIRLAAFQLQ